MECLNFILFNSSSLTFKCQIGRDDAVKKSRSLLLVHYVRYDTFSRTFVCIQSVQYLYLQLHFTLQIICICYTFITTILLENSESNKSCFSFQFFNTFYFQNPSQKICSSLCIEIQNTAGMFVYHGNIHLTLYKCLTSCFVQCS